MIQPVTKIINILKGATSQVMGMTVIGMSLSLLADILIAARLGTTLATDTLIIALSIPRMIEVIGREGTRFTLITLFVELYEKQEKADFPAFFSGLLNLYLLIGSIFTLLGLWLAPYIIAVVGPGLPPEYKQEATHLFRLAIFLVVFALGATVLEAFLNSQSHFVAASSRNVFLSGTVVLAIILGWKQLNVSVWIISAYAVGYFFFFAWLFWYSIKQAGVVYRAGSWPNKSFLTRIWRPIVYPTSSLGLRQAGRVAERAIASMLLPGGVAVYYFAFRLISAGQSIIGVTVATTGLPNISRLATAGEPQLLLKAIHKQVKRIVFIGLPALLVIFLFHAPIVNVIYGRFNTETTSVAQIGRVLQILGGSLLFWSIMPVFDSGLFALHKYIWVFYSTIIIVIINLGLAWILASRMGVLGIAWATTIAIMLNAFILYLMLRIGIWRESYAA